MCTYASIATMVCAFDGVPEEASDGATVAEHLKRGYWIAENKNRKIHGEGVLHLADNFIG